MKGKDFGGIAARVATQRDNCYCVTRRWRTAIAAVDAHHDKCQRAPFTVDRELDAASGARVANLNCYETLLRVLIACPSPLDAQESAEYAIKHCPSFALDAALSTTRDITRRVR